MSRIVTGMDVVNKAREYLETPYVHQGRQKGVGIDCIGLAICACHELGLYDGDHDGYSMQPGPELRRMLRTLLIPTHEDAPGIIIEMRWTADPQHVALRTDYGIIHTFNGGPRKVVETGLNAQWRKRITGRYKIPGVSYDH